MHKRLSCRRYNPIPPVFFRRVRALLYCIGRIPGWWATVNKLFPVSRRHRSSDRAKYWWCGNRQVRCPVHHASDRFSLTKYLHCAYKHRMAIRKYAWWGFLQIPPLISLPHYSERPGYILGWAVLWRRNADRQSAHWHHWQASVFWAYAFYVLRGNRKEVNLVFPVW